MLKEYKRPPLAFNGNKKNMLKAFREALQDFKGSISESTIFYDVFGGSGLLAHEAKRLHPRNKVVWNDYDNFASRLDMLEDTERMRLEFCKIVENNKKDKLTDTQAQRIKELLEKELQEKGAFDYVQLSSWFRFSNNYANDERDFLNTKSYFNRLNIASPLSKKDYLKGVTRVQVDFRELIKQAKEVGDFFLILDPPYIQTHKAHYKDFFGLGEFLELISLVEYPFVYFSSAKSEILVFIDFITNFKNFKNLHCKTHSLSNSADDDFILYKNPMRLF